jgi:hypothetical protein
MGMFCLAKPGLTDDLYILQEEFCQYHAKCTIGTPEGVEPILTDKPILSSEMLLP